MSEYDKESVDYFKEVSEHRAKNQDSYDKYLVQLAAGGLGLSFAFIKLIDDPSKLVSEEAIIIAWLGWAVAVISTLTSFKTASKAATLNLILERHIIEKTIKDGARSSREKEIDSWDSATTFFNSISYVAFIIGTLFFVGFMIENI